MEWSAGNKHPVIGVHPLSIVIILLPWPEATLHLWSNFLKTDRQTDRLKKRCSKIHTKCPVKQTSLKCASLNTSLYVYVCRLFRSNGNICICRQYMYFVNNFDCFSSTAITSRRMAKIKGRSLCNIYLNYDIFAITFNKSQPLCFTRTLQLIPTASPWLFLSILLYFLDNATPAACLENKIRV